MIIDNLFIVESPLQALVAVELSLKFEGQVNGIIYRLSGKERERNNEQIIRVIAYGSWAFQESVQFSETAGLVWHLNCRRYVTQLKRRFRHKVKALFFGEFRSQWMHFARFAIAPEKSVLLDDGAATLTVKHQYIDQGVFYPKNSNLNIIKKLTKKVIFLGLTDDTQIRKSLAFASAFLKDESEFEIDFSMVRKLFANRPKSECIRSPKVYFFGSKYSEASVVSRGYELDFIHRIVTYYKSKGLGFVYCAHRDESDEKLCLIERLGNIDLVRPSLPAELYILEQYENVVELAAAYSTVVNNLYLMFPDKPLACFRLDRDEVDVNRRQDVECVYEYYERQGISVKELSSR